MEPQPALHKPVRMSERAHRRAILTRGHSRWWRYGRAAEGGQCMSGDLITILGNNLVNVLGIVVTVLGFISAFNGAAVRIERTLRERFKGNPSRLAFIRFALYAAVNLVTGVVVIVTRDW